MSGDKTDKASETGGTGETDKTSRIISGRGAQPRVMTHWPADATCDHRRYNIRCGAGADVVVQYRGSGRRMFMCGECAGIIAAFGTVDIIAAAPWSRSAKQQPSDALPTVEAPTSVESAGEPPFSC